MYGDKAETRDGSVAADEMGAYESGRGGGLETGGEAANEWRG